jgi:hypothetical protein
MAHGVPVGLAAHDDPHNGGLLIVGGMNLGHKEAYACYHR